MIPVPPRWLCAIVDFVGGARHLRNVIVWAWEEWRGRGPMARLVDANAELRDLRARNRMLEAAVAVAKGSMRGSREDLRGYILSYPGPTRLHDIAFVTTPGVVSIYVYPRTPMDDAEQDAFHAYVGDGVPLPLIFTIHHRHEAR